MRNPSPCVNSAAKIACAIGFYPIKSEPEMQFKPLFVSIAPGIYQHERWRPLHYVNEKATDNRQWLSIVAGERLELSTSGL